MSTQLMRFAETTEKMMQAWYEHSSAILSHSGDLGFVREHFVNQVLSSFLPKSIIVGSGEIIGSSGNGKEVRSGQQDIILYRSDFPVFTSFTHINTYLIEGVIATIEIKSDLSKGYALDKAFKNVYRITSISKRVFIGENDDQKTLEYYNRVRKYVIGYAGWQDGNKLVENYSKALNNHHMNLPPDLIYQPGHCIVLDDGFLSGSIGAGIGGESTLALLNSTIPFTIFLFHLLKAIVSTTGSLVVQAPGINSSTRFMIDHYVNFPEQPFTRLSLKLK